MTEVRDPKKVGAAMKELRLALNLDLGELAHLTNLPKQTLINIEDAKAPGAAGDLASILLAKHRKGVSHTKIRSTPTYKPSQSDRILARLMHIWYPTKPLC